MIEQDLVVHFVSQQDFLSWSDKMFLAHTFCLFGNGLRSPSLWSKSNNSASESHFLIKVLPHFEGLSISFIV